MADVRALALRVLLASFDGGSAATDGANFWTELTTLF